MNEAGFAAIDFETATPDRASACAVGLMVVDGLEPVAYHWLVRPPGNQYFAFNSFIHGLGPEDTASSPVFADVLPEILDAVGDRVLVAHHGGFDFSVLRSCLSAAELPWPDLDLACTRVLSRRAWPGLGSYSLSYLMAHHELGEFEHHNPVADAGACATLAFALMEHTDTSSLPAMAECLDVRLGHLGSEQYRPCAPRYAPSSIVSRLRPPAPGERELPLSGVRVAFTGTLSSMDRLSAAQLVVDAGGSFTESVSKNTNYLVFGEQDFGKFVDGAMSTKTRKALDLISSGVPLQIIGEDDFLRLVWGGEAEG